LHSDLYVLFTTFAFRLSGNFEPPGAASLSTFVNEYEKELDPRWQAVKAAERRVEMAERATTQAPGQIITTVIELSHQSR
jgi:hypothetical protein